MALSSFAIIVIRKALSHHPSTSQIACIDILENAEERIRHTITSTLDFL